MTERKVNRRYIPYCLVALSTSLLQCQQASKGTDKEDKEIVRIEAKDEVQGGVGSKRPYIGITCSADKPTAFLADTYPALLDGLIYYRKGLIIQFDSLTPPPRVIPDTTLPSLLAQNWVETKDHSRLYSPTPAAFIKRLASAKTLRLEWESAEPGVFPPLVLDVSRWASTLANLTSGCSI